MKHTNLLASAALALAIAACSGAKPTSAPVISNLSIAMPVTPGAVSTGRMTVTNAAGLTGLELEVKLTPPVGATSSSTTALQGASAADEAEVEVAFEIAPGAPSGTYTVAINVLDGSESSNTLSTTFAVGEATTNDAGALSSAACAQLLTCCHGSTFPSELLTTCLEATSGTDVSCQSAIADFQLLGSCTAGSDAGTTGAALFCDESTIATSGECSSLKATDANAQAECTQDGGSVVRACPTSNLLGCCTSALTGEQCFYPPSVNVGSYLNQDSCVMSLGNWSMTP